MEDRLRKTSFKLISAIAEWFASLETLPGILEGIDPRVALAGTVLATATISFSRTLMPPFLGILAATIVLFRSPKEIRARALKSSVVLGSFSFLVMVPKAILEWPEGLRAAFTLSLRTASAIFVLMSCVSLAGARAIFAGFEGLGMSEKLKDALTLMLAHISCELKELSDILLARRSRVFSPVGFRGEYGILSSATSELFVRGPAKAVKLSAVIKARIWSKIESGPASLRSTFTFLSLSIFTTLAILLEVIFF